MSNYYRVRCWSCDEDCERPELNHGGQQLAWLLHELDTLLGIADDGAAANRPPWSWSFRVEYYNALQVYEPVDLDWLREHRAHLLFVRSEYSEELTDAFYVRARPGVPGISQTPWSKPE